MSGRRYSLRVPIIALVAAVAVYAIVMMLARQADDRTEGMERSRWDGLSALLPPDRVDLGVAMTELNPDILQATLSVRPLPVGDTYGHPTVTGWIPAQLTRIRADAVTALADGNRNALLFSADEWSPGFTLTTSVAASAREARADPLWFPFDDYTFVVPMEVSGAVDPTAAATDPAIAWQGIPSAPLALESTADTFLVTVSPGMSDSAATTGWAVVADEAREGRPIVELEARRNSPTQVIAIILGLLMLVGAGASLTLGLISHAGARPIDLGFLTWTAAITFSIVGIRTQLPGHPPVGVLLDYVTYFPALICTLATTVWLLVLWSRRPESEIAA